MAATPTSLGAMAPRPSPTMEPWRAVKLSTPLQQLTGRSVVVLLRDNKVLALNVVGRPGGVVVTGGELESLSLSVDEKTTAAGSLKDFLTGQVRVQPRVAMVVPELTMPHRPKGAATTSRPWRWLAIVPLGVAFHQAVTQAAYWPVTVLVCVLLVVGLWFAPSRSHLVGIRVPVGDHIHLSPHEIRTALKSGQPPPGVALEPPSPALAPDAEEALEREARDDVATVKEQYGALLSDVAYRIECAALFDVAVPLTKQFNLALTAWDDEERRAGGRRLAELAREVELTFATARDHAETVGMRHLPAAARREAELAAKAARLAQSAENEGERAAAIAQATRLLQSLALYYLPGPADFGRELT